MGLKDFEFVFNGKVSPDIEKLVYPYRDYINFVGTRKFSELYKLYSQASVLVLPTIEDGFAAVVTEAMACGVPVITTNHCCGADVIEDGVNGFLIPIRSSESIVEKVIYLYSNPEIHKEISLAAYLSSQKSLGMDSHGKYAFQEYNSKYLEFRNK
jgi:glycosyltransferase involved in cell wall biosynthesis